IPPQESVPGEAACCHGTFAAAELSAAAYLSKIRRNVRNAWVRVAGPGVARGQVTGAPPTSRGGRKWVLRRSRSPAPGGGLLVDLPHVVRRQRHGARCRSNGIIH